MSARLARVCAGGPVRTWRSSPSCPIASAEAMAHRCPCCFSPCRPACRRPSFLIARATDVNAARQAIRRRHGRRPFGSDRACGHAGRADRGALAKLPRARVDGGHRRRRLDRPGRRGPALAASYTVRRRKREIGIRVALGARANEIIWLVTAPVLWLVSAGAAAGLAAAVPIAILLRSVLFGAAALNVTGVLPSIAILLAVAAAAALGPAYHAVQVDPVRSLREE